MKRWHRNLALFTIAATASAAMYASAHTHPPQKPAVSFIGSGPVDIYPPSDVPGATNPDITQDNIRQNICNPHWSTKSIRPPASYTTGLKRQQIARYGLTDTNLADYEEDHLISLELGGSPTSPQNLWPEPYNASIQDGGAKVKDTVENYLHKEVCAGQITLDQAQHEISTDWYAMYKSM